MKGSCYISFEKQKQQLTSIWAVMVLYVGEYFGIGAYKNNVVVINSLHLSCMGAYYLKFTVSSQINALILSYEHYLTCEVVLMVAPAWRSTFTTLEWQFWDAFIRGVTPSCKESHQHDGRVQTHLSWHQRSAPICASYL